MLEEPEDLGELTHDAIAGDFRIAQRRRGHRYSIDDVMTAWEAACAAPQAARCLELGSGIGSVLLMLAYKLPQARFVAIEAQRNSFRLLTDNVRDNGLEPRVTLLHGDLREQVDVAQLGRFTLVTGTPPYVPPGTATPSSDSQKAYCRQELRGGVEDYLAAMGRVLAPDGVGVVCADARFPQRVFEGAIRAGLRVTRQRDVVPRAGHRALFAVFTLVGESAPAHAFEHARPWIARDEAGARTLDYLAVRSFFGIEPAVGELPSP
ncbi:MAG: tRNA ((6))-methyltransferase TrmN6 [Myxococcaceae bacterium]|nr:tRNA ((6))-methyltransferase TrmN6 [Myxococcaceae bacterium]